MYINLTQDQLDALYAAIDLATDDYKEQIKYIADKEDMESLSAAAKKLDSLRTSVSEQSKAAKEAGTDKIHVILSIDKDIIAKQMNYEESLQETISRELGWLHDSGMYVDTWSFAQDNTIVQQQPSRKPLVTDGTLKLPPEQVDMLNYCLTHNENEIADQYGAIGDDPQVWFDFTPDIEAILTIKILEGRSQLQLDLMHKGEPYAESTLMQKDTLDGSYTFHAKDGTAFTLTVEKDPEQQRVDRSFLFYTNATDLPKTAAYFNGKTCTILKQVEPKLHYEPLAIGEMMWCVKFPDGEILDVYDSELQPIPRKENLTSQIMSAEGKREQNAVIQEENQKER